MTDRREIVEAGDTLGTDTIGADPEKMVVARYEYNGQIPNDFRFTAHSDLGLTCWVIVDGEPVEEVTGYVRPSDYKPKGIFKRMPDVKVFGYLQGLPIEAAVGVEIMISCSVGGSSGATPVKGTVRVDAMFSRADPKVVNNLFNSSFKKTRVCGPTIVRSLSAKDLSDMISEEIKDEVRTVISPHPHAYSDLDIIEDEIVEKLNNDSFMQARGLMFRKASFRPERTSIEEIEDKTVRANLEIRNERLDRMTADLKKKISGGDDARSKEK